MSRGVESAVRKNMMMGLDKSDYLGNSIRIHVVLRTIVRTRKGGHHII